MEFLATGGMRTWGRALGGVCSPGIVQGDFVGEFMVQGKT